MRQVVRDAFHDFSAPLEGKDVPFFYLDFREPPLRCLVTIWLGNLCPLPFALTLPMVHPDGRYATKSEIAAAWNIVDARQDLGKHGGFIFGGLKGNELRLPQEAGEDMVRRKLDQTDATLRAMFPEWDSWPACAQLAIISWAWAVGPHSAYPRMFAALQAQDFEEASHECDINPKRGTIVLRNARNKLLLHNADRVRGFKLDPDTLNWSTSLDVSDVDTQPEFAVEPENAASRPTSFPPSPTQHVDPSAILRPREWLAEDDPDDAA